MIVGSVKKKISVNACIVGCGVKKKIIINNMRGVEWRCSVGLRKKKEKEKGMRVHYEES